MKTIQAPISKDRSHGADKTVTKKDKILGEGRRRFKKAIDYETRNRDLAEEDVEFRHGQNQWPEAIQRERDEDDRPCLTFNKLEERVDQVTGDHRLNRASIKVLAVHPETDTEGPSLDGKSGYRLAQVMNGLIRSIEQRSDAHIAYHTAADHAAGHGWGYWRILTEYDEFDPFVQTIRIGRIKNSFSCYMDSMAQYSTGADANWAFISTMMDKEEFDVLYPNATSHSWNMQGEGDDYDYWYEADNIRVVEYFRRVPVKKIAIKLSNDIVSYVDDDEALKALQKSLPRDLKVINTKEMTVPKVEWYKMSMADILEDPREFPSFYIPLVRCIGKELNYRGYDYYRGVVRHAKDAQRMYNYNRTAQIEQTALQPKVPYILTAEQVGNYENLWKRANKDNLPYLLYEHQEGVPPPRREPPPIPSTAHMMNAQSDDADIDATSGLHKASIGAPSNETSGKAIRERKMEGDVGTFAYHDNFHWALKHTGVILCDMIPRIYDTERVARIINDQDEDDFVKLNHVIDTEQGKIKIHDLSMGQFDVVVSTGPSFTTMREESRESMISFMQAVPDIGKAIADLVVENMDWPKADKVADRIREVLGIGDDEEGKITIQMVEEAVMAAQEATQEALDNQLKMMEEDRKRMEAERKADTDEFKAAVDAMSKLEQQMMDPEQIQDLVAQAIAQLMQEQSMSA